MDWNWLTKRDQKSGSQLRRLSRRLASVGGFLMIATAFITPALAQLRTGREERSLYHDRILPRHQQPPARASRDKHVVQASYQEPTSILEDSSAIGSGVVGQPLPSGRGLISGQSSSGYADDYDMTDYSGGEYSEGGGGSCGCDGLSELAPTCASACGLSNGCCDPFMGRGPIATLISRMSIRAEVPLFWRRAAGPPALVTTAIPSGTEALNQQNTNILFGNGPFNDDATAGFRLTLGAPLTNDGRLGLLFRYWNAGTQDDTFNFDSTQFPILARPFLNTTTVATGVQDSQIVVQNTATAESTGNVSVRSRSELDGLNIFLRRLMYQDRFTRVDWLYGYQHITIGELLSINSHTDAIRDPNPLLVGTSIDVSDNFATKNNFDGVVYGFMGSREIGRFQFESTVRLGLGNLQRRVNIDGSTTTTSAAPNRTTSTDGQGLLARNTNNSPFKDDTFVVIPEVGINAAYRIRRGLDFNVGYNYMMVPKVAQASRQLDNGLGVNLSNPLTGNQRPFPAFEERNYWINSLGLGLQWKY